MPRRWAALALAAAGGLWAPSLLAQDHTVVAIPLAVFEGAEIGGRVGGLVWRGGLELKSQSDLLGGLSGIGFVGNEGRLVIVSDRGNFVTGQLIYDEAARPFSFVGVRIEPINNSKGVALPRAFSRDAEGLAVIEREGVSAAVRVGFENLTRVADFELEDFVPAGRAKEVSIPDWLSRTRTNESLEAVCIAPPPSPVAGSTLLITENVVDTSGYHSAWLLGHADKGPLSLTISGGVNPTDCAFLPNGDLLVLERGIAFLTFTMKLRRIPAAEVRPGSLMTGETLLEITGGDIDNMEGLAVHAGPDGETRITLLSDNNFNDWERNLLLEFSLPNDPAAASAGAVGSAN